MKGDRKYIEYLGRAVHYLQDYSVDTKENFWIFEYRSERAHKNREKTLVYLDIPEKAIRAGLKTACTLNRVKEIIWGAKPHKNPKDIMFQATYLTAVAVKSVFRPKKPHRLEEKYRRARKIHVALILIPWLTVPIGITPGWIAAILSFVLHKLDFNYHEWKLEYERFRV